jgi:hypothetical protein
VVESCVKGGDDARAINLLKGVFERLSFSLVSQIDGAAYFKLITTVIFKKIQKMTVFFHAKPKILFNQFPKITI